ncbi:hypothetical protein REPUB_Repub11eG0160400 [Reevesia pubescens]
MEEDRDIFEKQVIGMNKTKVGKPPTRLQKQAPASLKLDRMKIVDASAGRTSTLGPSTRTSSEPATPIPLLTPLALSPNPFPETNEFTFPTAGKKTTTPAPAFGWKQQAAAGAGYVDASTLLALFQNKCVTVNNAH